MDGQNSPDAGGFLGGGRSFLSRYDPSELRVAAEFLSSWLPFLSADLCPDCTRTLSNRVRSLGPGSGSDAKSSNLKDSTFVVMTPDMKPTSPKCCHDSSSSSCGSDDLKEEEAGFNEEDARESEREEVMVGEIACAMKTKLSREERECFRFTNVKRKKDLVCYEKVKGRQVNILQGLELHCGVFNAAEQKRIVDFVYDLQDKGRRGELKARTFTAPAKWMKGKGRETIQFGCCYNYVVDKQGNPPGILHDDLVDPLPPLFKTMIKRLVKWHVLPPTCIPDSCIVNIYEEGDCIPPHIDSHDFVRPFCTVSFLSECKILFGSNLKVLAPGEFSGPFSLPLPLGSVLVMNGNGADVAKHCVPAVPTKRISITFRRMDESKRPTNYLPEPDLLGIQPLPYEVNNEPALPSLPSTPEPQTRMRQQPSTEKTNRRWSSGRAWRGGSSDRWRPRKESDS